MYKSVFRLSMLLVIFVFFSLSASAATIIVTNTNDSGPGSLRQAVMDAANGDTINFSVTGTITLTSGQITIDKSLNIIGPGAASLTIDGNNSSRIFEMNNYLRTVNIHGITFRNGNSTTHGGAIYSSGAMTITNSVFSGNSAVERGGAIYLIASYRSNIRDTTFSGNSADQGGAIYTFGPMSVIDSTFSGNSAVDNGGAIYVDDEVEVVNSTFSGNSALSAGGAFFTRAGSITTLTNSTISGNSATQSGGATYNFGSISVRNSIISDNNAAQGANCYLTGATFNANSNNIFGTSNISGGCPNGAFDIVPAGAIGTILAPLANNGGPTQTHALVVGSPALDAANTTNCPASDQRGASRVGTCDIGAFELNGTTPTVTVGTVSSTSILENGGTATIPVTVANFPSGDSLTIVAHIFGGSAVPITDYTIAPSLTFNANGIQIFTITGVADALVEGNETLTVNFSLQGAGSISGNGNQTVTIIDVLPLAFSKAFAPNVIAMNGVSTLTFTIDNTVNTISSSAIDFTDNLPAGMVVATPANASTTCTGGTLTAVDASGVISYTGGTLAAGNICTVSVDVTASAAGLYVNVTGDLTASVGNSGAASDTLTVIDTLGIGKSFTDDPVAPGSVVTLEFTVVNGDLLNDATDITFTDDLEAMLPGTVAIGLPLTDVCGVGSQLTGTSLITLTGGNLLAGTSCTFSVTLQLGAGGTDGDYVNTTSPVAGTILGVPVIENAATDTLVVATPIINVFDPAISKIGLLVPGQVGVTGEQLEWIITVSNHGSIAGENVTITDTIDSRLSINSVNAPGASVQVNGQIVSVTYPTISPGQTIQYSIFTTVVAGESVTNTVCIAGTSVCATGLSVGELPQTGESQRP